MVRELNQNKFGGEMAVTCNTLSSRSYKTGRAAIVCSDHQNQFEKPAASSSATPRNTRQFDDRMQDFMIDSLSATGRLAGAQGKLTNKRVDRIDDVVRRVDGAIESFVKITGKIADDV